ncbi:hypothetical protein LTR66_006727 [Elasticomyces elasticus]|nr:hypothetical protein LTR66_006727 [Elasticomyces elasticus]
MGKALRWARKGTTQDVQWVERQVDSSVDYVPALADKAVKASIQGDPHETPKADGNVDPWHASGIIESASGTRLTSYHAYPDGLVVFSKTRYGQVQISVAESSSSQAAQITQYVHSQDVQAATTNLTWRLDAQGYPEWWNGQQWIQGQYFSEHQKWMAWVGGQWYEYQF